MKIELSSEEIATLNFVYGYIYGRIYCLKPKSDLEQYEKHSLERAKTNLDSIMRKLNKNEN